MDGQQADRARRMRECVDATLKIVEDMLMLAKHEYGHCIDEAMVHIGDQFDKRAQRVMTRGDTDAARADYVNYCAVLVALSEARGEVRRLEEAVSFRDSVIDTMGQLDSL